MAETRRFAGTKSRSQLSAANNLSLILGNQFAKSKYRNPELECYDAYYEGRQYAGKPEWKQVLTQDNEYVPVRDRQPLLNYRLGQVICMRLASKLIGSRTNPAIKVEDDPDTEAFLKLVLKTSHFYANLLEPIRRELAAGSVLVRFAIIEGQYKMEHFLGKWCYPTFDDLGNLTFVKIQYVYEDENDLDSQKNPKKKWYKLELGPIVDVLYDNPEYSDQGVEPEFTEVSRAEHGLGFVQGEWFKPSEVQDAIDGDSLIEPIMGFIDEFNYNLSQSANAVSYNQDPQLLLKNMDEDAINKLIKSSSKAWSLGKDSEAEFLEAGLAGVEKAMELREKMMVNVQDITRVIMLDPEKIIGSAQSAKAMEVLHGPLVELIEELRPQLEKHLNSLLLKLALTTLVLNQRGEPTPIEIPQGYTPKSVQITFIWPPIFPLTMEDLQKKVAIASAASGANIISRETMTHWLAADFDVEDVEAEIAKIAAQPIINPFGGF